MRTLPLLLCPLFAFVACQPVAEEPGFEEPGVQAQPLFGDVIIEDPVPSFRLRGLAGKCAQVDAATRKLVLATCSTADSQKVQILEGSDRLVELRVQGQCLGPVLGWNIDGMAVEATDCNGKPYQRWMLDGDSLRVAASRTGGAPVGGEFPEAVLAVDDRSGREGSPLKLRKARRDESDYWDLLPNRAALRTPPTSGFQRVATSAELVAALSAATPGAVIQVTPGAVLDLTDACALFLGPRVTLRTPGDGSGRRPLLPSARLTYKLAENDPRYLACKGKSDSMALFVVRGEGARITGLMIEGPSTSTGTHFKAIGIGLQPRGLPGTVPLAASVDHCDLFGWQVGAVNVWAPRDLPRAQCTALDGSDPVAVVQRNYIHANRQDGSGYGVSLGADGRAIIQNNTFMGNRHAITGTGDAAQSYYAYSNLVLFSSPKEGTYYNQDFDMHGTLDGSCGQWRGGAGGERIWIWGNTFLGYNRKSFMLRGAPCSEARFTGNVTRRPRTALFDADIAVDVDVCGESVNLVEQDNRYEVPDPTVANAVGDFNGDGQDDVFLATGAAFYVSFSGKTTWRFRAAGTERIADLRFGDFDGDKRTDVLRSTVASNGVRRLEVKWGGEGEWLFWSSLTAPISDLAVGDFDGNGVDDLLQLDGTTWTVRRTGGTSSSFSGMPLARARVADVRVGRFDANATSDVLVDAGGTWLSLPGGLPTSGVTLGPARAPMRELRVADLNGDGISDVLRTAYTLVTANDPVHTLVTATEISYGGVTALSDLRSQVRSYSKYDDPEYFIRQAPVGRFDAAPGADVLFWRMDRRFDVHSAGTGAPTLHSFDDGVTKNEMY